jgi:hypothetical protein
MTPSAGDRGEIEQLVRRLAPQYEVDWKLALAVISERSSARRGLAEERAGSHAVDTETAARFGGRKW